MQNKPFHSAFQDDGFGRSGSLIDPPANTRLFLLFSLFISISIIVLCRLIWVQTQLQNRYLDALSTTTTEYEIIPARDGRILTESADVLATDVDQHQLQIHYRWLQDPVDEAWLKRQVRRQLPKAERKDLNLAQETKDAIQQQRLQLWRDIIDTTGIAAETFREQQLRIQQGVQRIANSVNQRRAEAANSSPSTDDSDGILMQWATAVREALTQSPRRASESRIAVREEESFHKLLDNVPFSVVATVEEQPHRFPGVRITTENQRSYPQPNIASHLVGARRRFTNGPNPQDDNAPEAAQNRSKALFGVEQSYNHVLQGIPGRRRIVRSRRYEIIESVVEQEAVSGRDITLTINHAVQKTAQQLLDDALKGGDSSNHTTNDQPNNPTETAEPKTLPLGGCVVVMEVQTGRIVAAASAPSFSLSLFTGATQQQWDFVNQDRRHPFLFRATQMAIPPGSAVKPLTAVAAMATGHLNPIQPFHCQGYLETPHQRRCLIYRLYGQSHGDVVLKDALAQSCNVYFFDAARKMGPQNLSNWFHNFGLGQLTGIDIPNESPGQLPQSSASSTGAQQNTAMGIAIGQNRLTTTPIQMTTAIAAIANGGYMVTPHLVSETGAAHLNAAIDSPVQQRSRTPLPLPDPRLLDFVQEGMEATVQSGRGTAYKTARLPNIEFAGKTGTAQSASGKNDHAWFVGYAPSVKPKYAFTVVLEHGGSGSRSAAPIAKQIIRTMQEENLLER